jgi:PPK2 family polyphosphate:nucleotide phosphotransferase
MVDVHFFRVPPGEPVDLDQWDPDDKRAFAGTKSEGKEYLRSCQERLAELQKVFYAENKHKLLIVLQALDAAGKDSTVRRVFRHVDRKGVRVAYFDQPTPEELAHDFLWRIHRHTPATREIVIFNRSHYEDILAVRVRNLAPAERWQKRYQHICDFERMLVDEGTTILKFYLNISKQEQKKRMQARLDEPEKQWKFRMGDLKDRAMWDEYRQAYEDVLEKTNSENAPWYIVPADRKWMRDLVVCQVIVDTLEGMNLRYPQPEELPDGLTIPD